jgi:hypothetical protein
VVARLHSRSYELVHEYRLIYIKMRRLANESACA